MTTSTAILWSSFWRSAPSTTEALASVTLVGGLVGNVPNLDIRRRSCAFRLRDFHEERLDGKRQVRDLVQEECSPIGLLDLARFMRLRFAMCAFPMAKQRILGDVLVRAYGAPRAERVFAVGQKAHLFVDEARECRLADAGLAVKDPTGAERVARELPCLLKRLQMNERASGQPLVLVAQIGKQAERI